MKGSVRMTKTDLNNIAGMRDPQFTKENFGNGEDAL